MVKIVANVVLATPGSSQLNECYYNYKPTYCMNITASQYNLTVYLHTCIIALDSTVNYRQNVAYKSHISKQTTHYTVHVHVHMHVH